MNHPRETSPHVRLCAVLLHVGLSITAAWGATNQATGDIGGAGADLADSNVVTLDSTGSPLRLVKRAYLPDGTRVPTTSSLPKGSVVDFLVYISNASTIQLNDISLQDVLDPAFVYQTGSIRVDNTIASCAAAVCNAAEEDNIHSVVASGPVLNDAVDADVASYSAGSMTIDVGDENVANARCDIAGQKVWAMVFSVSVP